VGVEVSAVVAVAVLVEVAARVLVEVAVTVLVEVAVLVADVAVLVGVTVLVANVPVLVAVDVTFPRLMRTYNGSPKYGPLAVAMRHVPRIEPVLFGAVMTMERSLSVPGLTDLSKTSVAPPMASPPTKANLKPASQAQVPLFLTCQVLVKVWPGAMRELSGMVTSLMKVRP
jgi:hypothetical protein